MKNLILTFAFLLTINLCCVGQIDTHVLEFNVGKSTKNEVVRLLQQNYASSLHEYSYNADGSILILKHVKLWGCEWSSISFQFCKGILYQMLFSYMEYNNTIHVLDLFDTVLSELNKVYGQYNITKDPQSLFQQLRDETFSIVLVTSSINGSDNIGLIFTDLILFNQISE